MLPDVHVSPRVRTMLLCHALITLGVILAALSWCTHPALDDSQVSLPRIGLAGALPDPDQTLIVTVTRDGRIRCGDEAVEFERYVQRVLEFGWAEGTRTAGGPWVSLRSILFRLDRALPYGALVKLYEPLARGDLQLNQVFFAVVSERTGQAGALALFLPDEPIAWFGEGLSQWRIGSSGLGVDELRSALHYGVTDFLRQQSDRFRYGHLQVVLCPASNLSVEAFLRQADALFRAGDVQVYAGRVPDTDDQAAAWTSSTEPRDLHRYVAATSLPTGPATVTCLGFPVEHDPRPMPAVAPTPDRFTGLAR